MTGQPARPIRPRSAGSSGTSAFAGRGLPFRAVPDIGDGIPLTGALTQHGLGNQGAGSKICLIDVEGGQWSNAIAAGYIPAGIPTIAFGPNVFDTGGNHGTSCMKIIYEMAPPGAALRGARLLRHRPAVRGELGHRKRLPHHVGIVRDDARQLLEPGR